jgi:hypothetical protein
MFTSFGYFEDAAENRQVLVNVRRSLKAGGKMIIEVMGKEVLARVFKERDWRELDGIYMLQERKVRRDWSWIDNLWILIDGNSRREYLVSHWVYSATELRALFLENGFNSATIYGGLDGSAYDHEAERLVAVATV